MDGPHGMTTFWTLLVSWRSVPLVCVGVWAPSVKGATLYCTNHPCIICAKMIINAGIVRIVVEGDYRDNLAEEMLAEAKIEVVRR
jgi:deoxycytidylate deaminase